MSSYLDQLNTVQRNAVTSVNGPVLVVAGPGSGKTRVLTYRIAYLIESGVKPREILALTFTNKAAREMKTRIAGVVGEKANWVWAGTFHSIFARILRQEATKIGYPSSFTIYDTQDTKNVLSAIIREQNLDPKVYVANAIKTRISSAKSNLISPAAYAENPTLLEQDKASKRPYISKIYDLYAKRCKRAGAMDFDDLLYQMFVLLHKNPDNVVEKYRERFKFVLVDEFQDTNFLQYQIIRKLVNYPGSPQNICAVGDDAQSIYAFRGATIQNILDFQKHYPNLKMFKLEQNYRSTQFIVEAANEVITYNKKQIQKKIWSHKGEGEKIRVIRTESDSEEGRRIANLILEQKTRFHLQNKDIAILYRTNAQSRVFEESLRRLNIPYRIFGGLSFYQRKEVKDVIAYLRLVINPQDEEAFRRVVNYPKRGIGQTSVDKISKIADDQFATLWEIAQEVDKHGFTARVTKPMKTFVQLIKSHQKMLETEDAYTIASSIAQKSGLIKLLAADNTVEGTGRSQNIQELLDGIKDFVEDDELLNETAYEDKSLDSYLQNIALLTDTDKNKENSDTISLMSVHSAKGLEYQSVFVVGMEEQLFPSFMAMQIHDGLDEERRLFYVAITRAEKYLTLSYAKSRYRFGNLRFNEPSRFLSEISPENLDMPVVSAGSGRATVRGAGIGKTAPPRLKNFRKVKPSEADPDFKPSDASLIKVGDHVKHVRFGRGTVQHIEGGAASKVATIRFDEAGEKRIMLKFAKLQIL